MKTPRNLMRPDSPRRTAATIIEVAATVGSVAMVSLLLLPALGEARRQGKEVRCLSNLGQLAGAALVYAAADANELAIPIHRLVGVWSWGLGEVEWGGKSGMAEPKRGQNPISSIWGTQQGRGPSTRGLNRIIYGDMFPDYMNDAGSNQVNWEHDMNLDLGVYRCPADYGFTGIHYKPFRDSRLTSYDHYGNSYAASTSWVGVPGPQCRIYSNTAFRRPISQVPGAAVTLLFVENAGRFSWFKNYGVDGCGALAGSLTNDVESPVRGWHGRNWRFQVTFVDGHAGTIRMEGHQKPEPQIGHYPRWNGQPTDHEFWRCAILRGPGWRIDTLPAAPVETDLGCSAAGAVVVAIQ